MDELKSIRFSEAEYKSGLIEIIKETEPQIKGFKSFRQSKDIVFTPNICEFMHNNKIASARVIYCTEEEAKLLVDKF